MASSDDISGVLAELEKRGVAVVPNVIDEATCDEHITHIHAWLATFGTLWPDNVGSIIHKYGLAHHPVAWKVRHQVKPVFEKLWGTRKLLSSFDGMSIGEPPELGRTKFETAGAANNLHHDQGPHRIGLHAYQGALYLEAAEHDDWCFCVIEGSHKLHKEFMDEHPRSGRSEFRKLTKEEIKWYSERGCNVVKIETPKGGLLLWDSRTVHAGSPPMYMRKNQGRWRYISFVSMTPAIWATPKDLSVKREAYKTVCCTNHWASCGMKMFPKGRRATPQDISNIPHEGRTEEARLMAGVVEYDFEDGEPNGPPTPLNNK